MKSLMERIAAPPALAGPVPAALLGAAYVGTGLLGLHFASAGPKVTLLWAPSGLALAGALLLGPRSLPVVFAAALLTHGLSDGPDMADPLVAAGNTAEAALGMGLLRWAGFQPALRRRRDLAAWVVAGVIVAPGLGAMLGVAALAVTQGFTEPPLRTLQDWWMGDAAGVLVFSPFVLAWATRGARGLSGGRRVEAAALAVGAFAACAVGVLGLSAGGARTAALVLLPLPFLIWAALRFGQRGTSTLTVGLAAGAVTLPALGARSLAASVDPTTTAVIWTATCAYAVAGLLLSFLNQAQSATLRRLATEEERLSLATRSARVGVWDWDLETHRVVRSGESTGMLGLEPHEIADTFEGWRARVHPDDLERLTVAWRAHVRGHADRYEADVRLRDGDGRWRWVRDTGLVVRRARDGQPQRAAGTQIDIHAEKVAQLAEAALRRLARALAAATTVAQAADALDDHVRELVGAEAFALYMLHADGRTLLPARGSPDTGPGFRSCSLEQARRAIATPGGPDPFTRSDPPPATRHDHPIIVDGAWIGALVVRGLPPADPTDPTPARLEAVAAHSAGALLRLRAEARRAELEEQVLHAQKLESLGVLAGGVAHDFNNMLAAILGNTGVALMELGPEHPSRAPLGDVEVAANRAAELCRGLLAYAGRGRTHTEHIPLNGLVEEMERLIDAGRRKNAELVFDLDPSRPAVEGDAAQLRQVVLNLITNASDALGPSGGQVRVHTRRVTLTAEDLARTWVDDGLSAGAYVALTVADTGTGMTPDVLARIFDPFFTTKFTGRGLGLAAVLGILRGHKGAVAIESAPNAGTTFTVYLPASAALDPTPTDPQSVAPQAPAGHALVVDDEATLRTLVARVLGAAGWSVDEAPDGQAGVDRVRAEGSHYDLVVLDLTMPRMGGTEALRHMRAHRPDLKVLLTSGYSDDESHDQAPLPPGTAFLAKPWTPDALHRTIAGLMSED